jgi:hypothetical protein
MNIQPFKMEQTDGSETSAFKNQTLGIHPKDYSQYSKHGESLKSRTVSTASGICHTINAICCYHGTVRTALSVLWVVYTTHSTCACVSARTYVHARVRVHVFVSLTLYIYIYIYFFTFAPCMLSHSLY